MSEKKKNAKKMNTQHERDENLKNPTAELEKEVSEKACAIYVGLVTLVVGLLQYTPLPDSLSKFSFPIHIALLIIEVWLGIKGMSWFHGRYHNYYCKRRFLKEHPNLDFAGTWYHVHIPAPEEGVSETLRAGTVKITQNYYELSFHGVNIDHMFNGKKVVEADDGRVTDWHYEAVKLSLGEHNSILGAFSATSSGEKKISDTECPFCGSSFENSRPIGKRLSDRGGIHRLTITIDEKGNRPCYIHGNYRDLYPSHSNGTIHIYDTRKARDRKIAQYLTEPEPAGSMQ